MNIYKQAEKELAELMGWTLLEWHGNKSPWLSGNNPITGACENTPEWCYDDAEAFKLMVEYEIDIKNYYNSVYATFDLHKGVFAEIDEHNQDRSLATRYATVQAVISKLKASK